MNTTQQPQSAPGAPESAADAQSPLSVTEAATEPHTAADRAWSEAHAYAIGAEISDPEAFADDYTSMIDEARHEPRYPDVPLPSPAEFVWP